MASILHFGIGREVGAAEAFTQVLLSSSTHARVQASIEDLCQVECGRAVDGLRTVGFSTDAGYAEADRPFGTLLVAGKPPLPVPRRGVLTHPDFPVALRDRAGIDWPVALTLAADMAVAYSVIVNGPLDKWKGYFGSQSFRAHEWGGDGPKSVIAYRFAAATALNVLNEPSIPLAPNSSFPSHISALVNPLTRDDAHVLDRLVKS